jgi:folate-binding protein YgfZ
MGMTALQQHAEGLGANFAEYKTGEYRGAITAARFGDPQAEFAALRAGCGVYDLGYRAKISLTGSDRVRWLNGMVTNNIRDLAVEHGVYAFLLNPQGHILGDLYAYNRGESGVSPSIRVETDRNQVEKILATFDHYIIMDDVEVANLSEQITSLGISGPKARAVIQKAGMQIPELHPLQLQDIKCDCGCGCIDCTIVRTDNPIESYEIWLAAEHVKPLWNSLTAAGAMPVGFEAVELQRIASGIPLFGVDIRERDLPQETEQGRALNFNKGCYVGQEIIERIRSRGAVHRKFSGFLVDGAVTFTPGTKIVASEKEVGEITSAATISFLHGEKTVALGYIRREVGTPDRAVMIGGCMASVIQLPVGNDVLSQESSLTRHSA